MSVRIRQLVKVTISGYLDFLYILVSFMKGKHQKNFFWKILFHTGLIACWSCAGRHSFVGNCSESEIWKKFSDEAQTCTLYNVCLKDDQKSWNVPKYVVVKASLEPTPQKLAKKKLPTLGKFICQCLHCLTDFFGRFDRPHDCLKLYHSLSMWQSRLL